MPSDSHFKLKIVAGLHKDAELLIDPNMRYTIGASDECDIVLIDSGVAEQHLCLTTCNHPGFPVGCIGVNPSGEQPGSN
jgi:pSer/pThr/pTyr-binding forkhead associated (FHA) protein